MMEKALGNGKSPSRMLIRLLTGRSPRRYYPYYPLQRSTYESTGGPVALLDEDRSTAFIRLSIRQIRLQDLKYTLAY